MNSSDKEKILFRILLNESLDGEITVEEIQRLNSLLAAYPDIRAYYLKLMQMQSALREVRMPGEFPFSLDPPLGENEQFWINMAEHEKTAPKIEISKDQSQRELVQKVIYPPRPRRKVNKSSIYFVAMNVAAVLFVILFLRFAPSTGIEVATLTDSINAKWADGSGSMDKGARLATRSDELFLQGGLAELLFDNNVKVVIEGPAAFDLLTRDQINLRYGRIYATVPRKAIGFTINTPTSRIIDLGTEFGVQADAFGDVRLHVIKGKTTLIAGDKSNKVNLEVTAGHAKKVSAETQEVSDISCETELFARDIRSDSKCVWRGQTELSLADMVGGGNGLGTGRVDAWLNLKTGRGGTDLLLNPPPQMSREELEKIEKRFTDNRYKRVSYLPYVDGVFSPDGGAGDVRVSSQGDVWSDCPDTSGIYFEDIFNGPYLGTSYSHKLILGGQTYGSKEHPAIALHSNAGITFDLDAIRADMPDLEITQFKSICGVSTDAGISNNMTDFWVLVDGKKRFESLKMKADSGSREVTVPLGKEDRFLTLVVSDGDLYPNSDWGFFALPRLEIETSQSDKLESDIFFEIK